MAGSKSPINGDLASKKQQLIDKLLNKFAKDIAAIQQIPLEQALKIAEKDYKKAIEQIVEQLLNNQNDQIKAIESALEDQQTDKLADKVTQEIETTKEPGNEVKNPMNEVAKIAAESKATESTENPNPENSNFSKPATAGNSINTQNGDNKNLTKPDNSPSPKPAQNSNLAPGNQTTNDKTPTQNGNQQSQQNHQSQPQSNPLQNIASTEKQLNEDPKSNGNAEQNKSETPNFKQPNKIPTNIGDNKTPESSTPTNNVNLPPSKTKSGSGNLKPGNGQGNTKPSLPRTTLQKGNGLPGLNNGIKSSLGRGAGRIGGAVPGGFSRSGANYTGNRFKKDFQPVTIDRIQNAADTGFGGAANVQKQAMENLENGNLDKGQKQLGVAKSIQQKASRLAAISRRNLFIEGLKKQLIKLAIPIIINALLAALFVGGFILFTIAVICVLDRTPILQNLLPSELKGLCGGKKDGDGNVSCPDGYTAWAQDPTGKWVQTAKATVTGETGNVTAGTDGIPSLPYKTSCSRLNAFLRAIIFKESVLTPNSLVPGPEGVFYWRFPSTPFAKTSPQPHPDISAPGPSGSSNAAGAFQFLSDSYYKRIAEIPELMNPLNQDCKDLIRAASTSSASKEQVRRAGTDCVDFSPTNQTRAAMQYLKLLGVEDTLCKGNGSDEDIRKAIDQSKNTWASLPGGPQAASGYSSNDFIAIYRKLLKEEAGNANANIEQKSPNLLATVTNNFKQFFQPIRAEAQTTITKAKIDQVQGLITAGKIVDAIQIVAPNRPSLMVQISTQPVNPKAVDLIIAIANSGQVDSFRITSLYRPDNASAGHREGRAIDIDQITIKGQSYTHFTGFVGGNESATAFANFGNYLAGVGIDYLITAGGIYSKLENSPSFTKDRSVTNKPFIQDDPGVHSDHFHIEVGSKDINTSGTTTTTTTSGPVICCPPGVTPSGAAITGGTTSGTLSDAKDSGNEFSQLSSGHKAFMAWVAKERKYLGPFADNGGPDSATKTAADKLMAKAKTAGINLVTAGEDGKYGYRGYNAQTAIFLGKIPANLQYQDSMGAPDKVPQNVKDAYLNRAKLSAPVGYSEHHTGKAVDFITVGMTDADLDPNVYNKTLATWLATNAPKEGFKLSYPQGSTAGAGYEPWHWLYTGQKIGKVETQNNNFNLSKLFTGIKVEAATIQEGSASFYGGPTDTYWQGRATASGEIFDENKLTAASNTLPLGSYAKVTNKANSKSVVVKINDTGGFTELGRVIDLSYAAALAVDMVNSGIANVSVEAVDSSQANNTSTASPTTTSAGCVQASASNNSPGTNKPGNVPSNGGKTQNSGTYDTAFLKSQADGILPIFSSARDCYRVVAGAGSTLEKLDPDMINGLVASGLVDRAYQFHDFMQQSSGGVPNYVRYGYEYSTDTGKLQRGSLVVLSKAINGDSGDMNVFIGRTEMNALGRGDVDSWMGRPIDNQSNAAAISGIYTKIKK